MAVVGAGKKLAWSNYSEVEKPKPGPTPNSQISAGTGLSFDVGYNEAYGPPKPGKVVLKCTDIKVEILLGGCWVAKGNKTDALLSHEQGHYRIQELGALELDAQLKKIVVEEADLPTAQQSLKTTVDTTRDDMDTLVDTMQNKYDSAPPSGTNHGLDASNQSRWDLKAKAASDLTKLKDSV